MDLKIEASLLKIHTTMATWNKAKQTYGSGLMRLEGSAEGEFTLVQMKDFVRLGTKRARAHWAVTLDFNTMGQKNLVMQLADLLALTDFIANELGNNVQPKKVGVTDTILSQLNWN